MNRSPFSIVQYGMPESVSDQHTANTPADRTQRIALVVDDEPGVVVLCTKLLMKAGYEVQQAQNGKEALEIIHGQKPDIVFLDLMMPVMDGFEVCERVKKDPETSDIVIAVISALDTDLDKQYAFSLGANFYFPKPFYPKQFLNEILPTVETALKSGSE